MNAKTRKMLKLFIVSIVFVSVAVLAAFGLYRNSHTYIARPHEDFNIQIYEAEGQPEFYGYYSVDQYEFYDDRIVIIIDGGRVKFEFTKYHVRIQTDDSSLEYCITIDGFEYCQED